MFDGPPSEAESFFASQGHGSATVNIADMILDIVSAEESTPLSDVESKLSESMHNVTLSATVPINSEGPTSSGGRIVGESLSQ